MADEKHKFVPSAGGDPREVSEMLPVIAFEDNMMIHANGAFAKGMELFGPSDEGMTEAMLEQYNTAFSTIYKSLDKNITMVITSEITSNAREIIEYHEGRQCENKIFNRIHELRLNKIKEKIEKKELRRVRTYMFLYYKPVVKDKKGVSGLFSSRRSLEESHNELHTDALNVLQHQADLFKRILSNTPFKLVDHDESDYTKIIYEYLNPARSRQTPHIPAINGRPVREALALSGLFIDRKWIEIGGYKTKFITMDEWPEKTAANMISALFNLRLNNTQLATNLSISVIVSVPDQEKIRDSLRRSSTKAAGFVDDRKNAAEAEVQLEDTEDLLTILVSSNEKLLNCAVYIRFSEEDEQTLKTMESGLLSSFYMLNGSTGLSEDVANLPLYIDTFPGFPYEKYRKKPLRTAKIACLTPIYRYFEGSTNYPAVLFENKYQGVVGFGLNDDKDMRARHVLIFGMTGAGKSFFCNYMLGNYKVFNPIYRVLDASQLKESSYKNLFSLLNLESKTPSFIQIDLDKGITINMFDIDTLTQKHVDNLANIIEVMVLNPDEKAIPKLKRVQIEKDIRILYEKNKKPTLSDFCEVCRDPHFKEILQGIWCRGGKYGKLMDGESNVKLDGRALAFDLKNLAKYPDLQKVMILMLIDNIWQVAKKYEHDRKVICLDEAWSLLSSTAGQQMISDFYRTMRGANGVAVSISQSLSDFTHPAIKAGMFENTGTIIVCKPKMSDSVYDNIKKELSLNDSEIGMIKNLEYSTGEYNDVFMHQTGKFGVRSGVVRVAPTPFELWTYTTDPDDNKKFSEYQEKYPDDPIDSILERLAKDFPKGAK